jgi:sulfatase modifying factor 1
MGIRSGSEPASARRRKRRGVPTCVAALVLHASARGASTRRSRAAELFGFFDLHGLVWEWTSDFNSAIVTGDARGDTGLDRQLFCGAGSAGAKDTGNFPAFMRYGFRSSLKAPYTVHNLGFRCAKDL